MLLYHNTWNKSRDQHYFLNGTNCSFYLKIRTFYLFYTSNKGAVAKRKNATVPFAMLTRRGVCWIKAKNMWKTRAIEKINKASA